ncbi:delta 1-pyrroline-5-carboxylate reductase [Aspergillus nanangensis]|uniref:Delta 1-pyrroline-5-carboxylate reductase n=1 Tax=Aspergillus nanangensis TaxID=2582783 RepID=A0AAD4CH34_ASPNN|nr:delta 1-pyrroline-5-carboxylate reductase [Aspergillus nanangensis]
MASKTLAFIGCGNMGSAILSGLLDATRADNSATASSPPKLSHFIINTKTATSADRLRTQFQSDASRVEVLHAQNVRAMQTADVILLACKPFLAAEILREPGVQDALAGKFVISIMAGMTPDEIAECIFPSSSSSEDQQQQQGRPVIVRAMPNVAARLRKSLTIVEESASLSAERAELLTWMFEQIGAVKYLGPELFDAGGMVAGASMAMFTMPLDGLLDGSVVLGIRRSEALEMVTQVLADENINT